MQDLNFIYQLPELLFDSQRGRIKGQESTSIFGACLLQVSDVGCNCFSKLLSKSDEILSVIEIVRRQIRIYGKTLEMRQPYIRLQDTGISGYGASGSGKGVEVITSSSSGSTCRSSGGSSYEGSN